MIGRLHGQILDCSPGRLLLDVTGVGYELQIPLSTFYALSGEAAGSAATLHVHTYVREEALQLFGFATRDERSAFEQLIAISGVGPRMALAILSGIGIDELRQAVRIQDRERLQQIPGVGRKTAERLLLELRDRMQQAAAAGETAAGAPPDLRADALSALVNLGYSRAVAGRVIDRVLDGNDRALTLKSVLRNALAGLVR